MCVLDAVAVCVNGMWGSLDFPALCKDPDLLAHNQICRHSSTSPDNGMLSGVLCFAVL